MSFVTAAMIVGGAGLASGLIGASAANSAANTQAGADRYGEDLQNQQFEETRSDQQPWRDAGGTAIGQLSDLTKQGGQLGPDAKFTGSDLYSDPSYKFRLDQGLQAVQRSAAARGSLASGGTLKGVNDYAGNSASQEYGAAYGRWNNDNTNTYNRLAGIAGLGQQANSSTAQAGSSAANAESSLASQVGQAQAAGAIGQANAWSGAINSGTSNWMNMQMLSKLMAK